MLSLFHHEGEGNPTASRPNPGPRLCDVSVPNDKQSPVKEAFRIRATGQSLVNNNDIQSRRRSKSASMPEDGTAGAQDH